MPRMSLAAKYTRMRDPSSTGAGTCMWVVARRGDGCRQWMRPSLLHGYAPKENGVVDPPMVTGRCVSVMQGVLTLS